MEQNNKPALINCLQILLGFAGTVIVAYLGYLGVRATVETPIHATQTAEARVPSISPTATPGVAVTATLTQDPYLIKMYEIYSALTLEDLVTDKYSYTVGETVVVSFSLTNYSSQTLVVPENRNFSRHIVGGIQTTIQRLAPDGSVGDGNEEPTGGTIIDVEYYLRKRIVEPGESIPINYSLSFINTSYYPPGLYRCYVHYDAVETDTRRQTVTVDFEIR